MQRLNISFPFQTTPTDKSAALILFAIKKYESHPSVNKIKDTFSFKDVDYLSVLKEFNSLNESKSSPIDSVPVRVLKEHSDVFIPKVVFDFNSFIRTGIFPNKLKLAEVKPIFKKNDKLDKENFRPVRLLPPRA